MTWRKLSVSMNSPSMNRSTELGWVFERHADTVGLVGEDRSELRWRSRGDDNDEPAHVVELRFLENSPQRHSEPSPIHLTACGSRSPDCRPPPHPAAGHRSAFLRERTSWCGGRTPRASP